MADASADDDLATCAIAPDLAEATAIASFLCGHQLDATVADSTTANMVWTWQQALGGIRVQVPKHQLAEAQELLASRGEPEDADEVENPADHAARRAMLGSIVGWLMLPLLHPLTLVVALRAARLPGLSATGKRHITFALVHSVLGLAVGGVLAFFVLRAMYYSP